MNSELLLGDIRKGLELPVLEKEVKPVTVVLGAMALETPIVATSAGGTADLVRDGLDGLIVPVGEPALLEEAVERALSSSETCRAMADSARQRIESTLSFETRMRSVERVYDDMLRPGWADTES